MTYKLIANGQIAEIIFSIQVLIPTRIHLHEEDLSTGLCSRLNHIATACRNIDRENCLSE